MATLGKTSDGTGQSSSSANKAVVSKHTAGASGIIVSGAARLWVDSGSATVKMIVHLDSSNAPGALLALSDAVVISNTSEAEIAFTFSDNKSIVSAVDYWVGFTWPDPGTNSVFWSRDATAGASSQNSSYQADPFGAATTLSGPIDAYVNHFPASAEDGAFFEFF